MKIDVVSLFDVKTDNITDYKKTSLLLVTPKCSGKCGEKCQNYNLLYNSNIKQYKISDIVGLYNTLTTHKAVVFAGLEPFDTFDDTEALVDALCNNTKPVDIVIYTGYEKEIVKDKVKQLQKKLKQNKKLIIKYGAYLPDKFPDPKFSPYLGVTLATSNQYAECYSIASGLKEEK